MNCLVRKSVFVAYFLAIENELCKSGETKSLFFFDGLARLAYDNFCSYLSIE